jgi:hypothetical protein
MAEERDGFEINGVFYPWFLQPRMLDSLLIKDVTGMSYQEFLEGWRATLAAIEDNDESGIDPVVMNGLIAVSFWQQHTDWSRQKVVRYFERLNQDDVEIVGGEEPDEEDKQTDPLSVDANSSTESGSSSTTPSSSNGSPESPSEAATRLTTGTSTSGMSSPE